MNARLVHPLYQRLQHRGFNGDGRHPARHFRVSLRVTRLAVTQRTSSDSTLSVRLYSRTTRNEAGAYTLPVTIEN